MVYCTCKLKVYDIIQVSQVYIYRYIRDYTCTTFTPKVNDGYMHLFSFCFNIYIYFMNPYIFF